jgi:hypothetical protein
MHKKTIIGTSYHEHRTWHPRSSDDLFGGWKRYCQLSCFGICSLNEQEFVSKQLSQLQSLLHCMPPSKLMISPLQVFWTARFLLIENDHFRFVSARHIQSLLNASLSQDVWCIYNAVLVLSSFAMVSDSRLRCMMVFCLLLFTITLHTIDWSLIDLIDWLIDWVIESLSHWVIE